MQEKNEMTELLTNTLEPRQLTDETRLTEIYDLRVTVWENSEKSNLVNSRLFQNGWYDELDKTARHWIITDEEDLIIASARLNRFNNLECAPYYNALKRLNFPQQTPLGFLGRLVVHPDYQGMNLSAKLIGSRLVYCKENNIQCLYALVSNDRISNKLQNLSFKEIGQIDVNYHESTHAHAVGVFVKNRPKEEKNKYR